MINIWAHLKYLINDGFSIYCFSLTILLYTHNTHWAHFVSLILDFFARHLWITVEGRSHYFWDLRGTYMTLVMGRARKFCQYPQTMFSWVEVSHKACLEFGLQANLWENCSMNASLTQLFVVSKAHSIPTYL